MLMLLGFLSLGPGPSVPYIPLDHWWSKAPAVRVCPDKWYQFDRWERAVDRTEKHGAKWSGITHDPCTVYNRGDVYIMSKDRYFREEGVEPDASLFGLTHCRKLQYNSQAINCRISYGDKGVEGPGPEHELLHAQGLEHHTMTNHVMSEYAEIGGWRWDGIRSALRRLWD